MITIVLPTRNEAAIIRANLERLLAFLRTTPLPSFRAERLPAEALAKAGEISQNWKVIVADNASTDDTRAIVREIAARESSVELLEIPAPGKGGAVLRAWTHALGGPPSASGAGGKTSSVAAGGKTPGVEEPRRTSGRETPGVKEPAADVELAPTAASGEPAPQPQTTDLASQIFAFMDADLATDLNHLPELVAAISGGADIAIGSRYLPGSRAERGMFRRLTSWCYRVLLRLLFGLHVSDPPCGFKAVSERVVREIVPQVTDQQWFFDTELLIRSQRAGLRIVEIPVEWREPRRGTSFRKVLRIILNDLRAMWRLLCEQQS